jgi:hypothetical protein
MITSKLLLIIAPENWMVMDSTHTFSLWANYFKPLLF